MIFVWRKNERGLINFHEYGPGYTNAGAVTAGVSANVQPNIKYLVMPFQFGMPDPDEESKIKEREHKRRLDDLAKIRKQQRDVARKLKAEVRALTSRVSARCCIYIMFCLPLRPLA